MSAVLRQEDVQQRTVTMQQTTRVTKDELLSVTPVVRTILNALGIRNHTGSITIHTNRGGICEISFTQKS